MVERHSPTSGWKARVDVPPSTSELVGYEGAARANTRESNERDMMVLIPPGQVTLHDRRTSSRWTVELASFRLAHVPVTQALYEQVTGLRPSSSDGDRLPVENVSWSDAIAFCNELSRHEGLTPAYRFEPGTDHVEWDPSSVGYRLPTEAEWEYACRAGTTGPRYGPLDQVAWYRGNSGGKSHNVASKEPNAWGLHDLLGNVWEWCWDLYDPDVYGAYRVLRGGAWFDEHWSCRASVRRRSHPTFQIEDVGLRIARSLGSPA